MCKSYSLKEIAEYLGARVKGDDETVVSGLGTLSSASENDLSFVSNPKYIEQLAKTKAAAVIMAEELAEKYNGNCLLVNDAYLSYAKISHWFNRVSEVNVGIHPSAQIDASVQIGNAVSIGPNVVLEANVKIASNSVIKANTVIGARSEIGENAQIAANVTIYHDVRIGDRVSIHSGAVIGADGFGFAPNGDKGWQKISQIGGVIIGDDVEIGASTTVDRGAINDTQIGDSVILDNHVQISVLPLRNNPSS
jgi:UDP-3-O-[3-hydroxymyristoyl] glucosamine N-acyltransferase